MDNVIMYLLQYAIQIIDEYTYHNFNFFLIGNTIDIYST